MCDVPKGGKQASTRLELGSYLPCVVCSVRHPKGSGRCMSSYPNSSRAPERAGYQRMVARVGDDRTASFMPRHVGGTRLARYGHPTDLRASPEARPYRRVFFIVPNMP